MQEEARPVSLLTPSSPPPSHPLSSGAVRPLGCPCPPGSWGQHQPCTSHPGSSGCISEGRLQCACSPGAQNSGSQVNEKFLRKGHLVLLEVDCWQGPPTCWCVVRKWKFNYARHQFSAPNPVYFYDTLFAISVVYPQPLTQWNTKHKYILITGLKKRGGGRNIESYTLI